MCHLPVASFFDEKRLERIDKLLLPGANIFYSLLAKFGVNYIRISHFVRKFNKLYFSLSRIEVIVHKSVDTELQNPVLMEDALVKANLPQEVLKKTVNKVMAEMCPSK